MQLQPVRVWGFDVNAVTECMHTCVLLTSYRSIAHSPDVRFRKDCIQLHVFAVGQSVISTRPGDLLHLLCHSPTLSASFEEKTHPSPCRQHYNDCDILIAVLELWARAYQDREGEVFLLWNAFAQQAIILTTSQCPALSTKIRLVCFTTYITYLFLQNFMKDKVEQATTDSQQYSKQCTTEQQTGEADDKSFTHSTHLLGHGLGFITHLAALL